MTAASTVPWRFNLDHAKHVAAAPDDVWTALTQVSANELALARFLMTARSVPARLTGRTFEAGEGIPLLDGVRQRFTILGWDEPHRIELGRIAKFWLPVPKDAPKVPGWAEFADFAEPGYAKAVMTFELTPDVAGTTVRTQTHVAVTDRAALIKFGAYWTFIRAGAVVIRHALLTAVEDHVARTAAERRHQQES